MNLLAYLRYRKLLLKTRPRRYTNLFITIAKNRCRRILEVGTWRGIHAVQMIQTAIVHHAAKDIDYYGFDLFEELTEADLKAEFSKNPATYHAVQQRIQSTEANIHLYKGNTRITLPQAVDHIGVVDLIFIDGGHSIETITSDWNAVRRIMGKHTTVIFDDYYLNTEPEVEGVGCQTLITSLDRQAYEVEILQPTDSFVKDWGVLAINMVKVKGITTP